MTISLTGPQEATLESQARGFTVLLDLEFSTGTIYVTPYSVDIPANGHTYTALGSLLSVSPVRESESLSTEKLKLKLSIASTAMLAYAIGPASVYRGRNVRLYYQMIGSHHEPLHAPIQRWSGIMDRISIDRSPSKTGKGSGSIEMECIRNGLARLRTAAPILMTNEQQQRQYPGDLGLEYTDSLVRKPPVWLSKAFLKEE